MKSKRKIWLEIIGYFSVFMLSFVVSTIMFIAITYFTQGKFSADTELNINNIIIVSVILCLLMYMLIIRKEKQISLWKYCQARKLSFPDILLTIGLGIILSISIGFLTQLDVLQQLSTTHDEKISKQVQSDSILVLMLIVGTSVPFIEEIIFRGLMYQTLKTRYSMTTTIIIQATIFAVIHVNPLQMLYAFILGLVFVWLVVRLNSLWASILTHMSFNLTTIVIVRIIQEKESVFLFIVLIVFAIASLLIGIAARVKKSYSAAMNRPR